MSDETDQEALSKVIASRAWEPREPFRHEYLVADLILASDWLAARDAELIAATRRQALDEAVEAIHVGADGQPVHAQRAMRYAIRVVANLRDGGDE